MTPDENAFRISIGWLSRSMPFRPATSGRQTSDDRSESRSQITREGEHRNCTSSLRFRTSKQRDEKNDYGRAPSSLEAVPVGKRVLWLMNACQLKALRKFLLQLNVCAWRERTFVLRREG